MIWRITLANPTIGAEEEKAALDVLRSGWLSMGRVTEEFESKFASMLGVRYAFATSSGTAALHLASLSLGVGPGDEVIVPSLTFVATVNAFVYDGAVPVFAEITGEDNLNISPQDIERRITSRTKGIVVVHYAGYPVDIESVLGVARRHNLWVVEDAAHAPLARLSGRFLGTFGDVAAFSFFPNKNMTTGEGGMVVTNREDLADRIRLFRSHGMTTLTWERHKGHAHSYDVVALGRNYRIDELRSALGLVQLRKLAENNRKRGNLTELYRKLLADVDDLKVPFIGHPGEPAYHIMPVLVPLGKRKKVIDYMRRSGIQTSVHYPPVHLFTYYRERFGFREGALPTTERVALSELTLPLYPGMTEDDIAVVVETLKEALTTVC
ncbi:DegT/DnrJ/EryC1/StrS family aminotransferase [bacterium]|nr:DegT/DnrJ/EryC1/StrS family aminotransferase [bacterium]